MEAAHFFHYFLGSANESDSFKMPGRIRAGDLRNVNVRAGGSAINVNTAG
jgi:hypothetical protein